MNLRIRWLIRNIFRLALPMLSPIILLGFLSFIVIQGELNTEIREKNIQLLQQTNQSVETVFGTIELVGANFDTNAKKQQMLKTLLGKPDTAPYSKDDFSSISYIQDLLRSYEHSNPYIHSIYIYAKNPYDNVFSSNALVTSDAESQNDAWLESYRLMDIDETHLICQRSLEKYPYESGIVKCITISREIQNTAYSKTRAGVIVVNFRKNMIEDMLKDKLSAPSSALFMVGPDGDVIASASQIKGLKEDTITIGDFTGSGVSEWSYQGSQYICFSDISKVYGFKLISMIPSESFYQHTRDIFVITAVLLTLSLIIGSIISYYIAHKNYVSLSSILTIIKAAENNEPLPIALKTPKNEYEYLLQNMINVFIKKSTHRTRIAENKYALRTLELMILQEQINPHFLINTLKTIFWKTVGLTSSPNEASRMIEYLTDLLSFVLSVSGYRVPLKQEITYTQSYLNIQRIRYNDKFKIVWHYDTGLETAMVMKLLLQPILENSILHGIANGEKNRYIIKISISKKDNKLQVRITDNGEGMNAESLRKVRSELDKNVEVGKHIGLNNVKQRLEVLYSKQNVRFAIHSKLHIGTSVLIIFPYEEFEQAKQHIETGKTGNDA